MLKFNEIFNDNYKIQLLSEFEEYQKSNNGDCYAFKEGLSAVPSHKDGTNVTAKVYFYVEPKSNNGTFEIINGGFSAVPNQKNGKSSISNKGLSTVPLQKNGTNF